VKRIMTAVVALVALAAMASTAVAAQQHPTTEVTTIDHDVNVDDTLCGFDITFVQNGNFKVTTYYDKEGAPVKSILTNYNSRFTETATANGKTLATNFPAVYITSYPSGSTVQNGLRASYHVPGVGVVALDAGLVSLSPTGDVLFEAGPHQFQDGSAPAFCDYFAA